MAKSINSIITRLPSSVSMATLPVRFGSRKNMNRRTDVKT